MRTDRPALDRLRDARSYALEAAVFDRLASEEGRLDRYAVRYCLLVVGEALRAVPAEVTTLAPSIPWRAIIGLRHRLAHDYWLTDDDILRKVARGEVPDLVRQLDALIAEVERQADAND